MYSSTSLQQLSPPYSPLMSDQERKPTDQNWPTYQHHSEAFQATGSAPRLATPVSYSSSSYGVSGHPAEGQALPGINDAYAAYASSSLPSGSSHRQSFGSHGEVAASTSRDSRGYALSNEHRDSVVGSASTTKTLDTSASRISDDEELDEDDDDSESELAKEGDEERQLTAAEIRQQKRKMKRFRLTHQQTRYLMSEFTRDAHPDAAHRERLSQEIPGLSPRQVQVWFQNRRAKLKRMSVEDRERMMRSRALPEHFTMGQSSGPVLPQPPPSSMLMQPYGGPRYADMRPLSLDTMQRGGSDSTYTSPTSVTPALGAFSFTPPQSAGVAHSPGAMGLDNRGFGFRSVAASPRTELLSPVHGASASFSSSFPSGPNRLPTLDRQRPSSVEYQTSGLRPGLAPYPGAIPPSMPLGEPQDRRSSLVQPTAGVQREMGPPSSLVGLGFAFDSVPNIQTPSRPPQPQTTTGQSQLMYGSGSGQTTPGASQSYPPMFDYSGSPSPAGPARGYPVQQQQPQLQTGGYGPSYTPQMPSGGAYGSSSAQGLQQGYGSYTGSQTHYDQQRGAAQEPYHKTEEPGKQQQRQHEGGGPSGTGSRY